MLDPLVLVADRQAHPGQAALAKASEELDPERSGLDLADVDADHLAHPGLMHRIRDHQRLGDHAAAVADLDVLGVQPQIRIGALQRPLAKRVDLLIQPLADR